VRLSEPATDLAVALAIASSVSDTALPAGLVAFGELGLAGDIRTIGSLERRLGEAYRLGFTDAIAPGRTLRSRSTPPAAPRGMRVHEVGTIQEAIAAVTALSRRQT